MTSRGNIELDRFLPQEIAGYRKIGPDVQHTPDDLYQYIDGGAELFISYGFRDMAGRQYARAEDPDDTITVDIFDMGHSFNAFGVFSQGCETIQTTIGQASQYAGGLLTLWKGRFYISIMGFPGTEQKKEVVFTLAQGIARSIPEEGAYPPVIALLPPQGLVPASIRYFHHHTWQNSHFFISSENILHIDNHTEAVLARYKEEDSTYLVMAILYPEITKARAAHRSFLEKYLPGAGGDIKKRDDGRWTGCRLQEKLLIVVFNAASPEKIDHVFANVGKVK